MRFRLHWMIPAAAAVSLAACADTVSDDYGARPGENFEPEMGVVAPTPVPDDPDLLNDPGTQTKSGPYQSEKPLPLPDGDR